MILRIGPFSALPPTWTKRWLFIYTLFPYRHREMTNERAYVGNDLYQPRRSWEKTRDVCVRYGLASYSGFRDSVLSSYKSTGEISWWSKKCTDSQEAEIEVDTKE